MNKQLPYDRSERVADAIHQLVSQKMLSDISDPRLEGIQITRVKMTKDLRIARIYYHLFEGTAERKENAERGFKSASRYLRRMIGEEISLKFTPEVEFYYDDSVDLRDRIDELLAGSRGEQSDG